ncbi:hypothetical protein OII53_06130 [Achromobacter ruhlandii]|jgi:hypothetical protein|uniref:DUF7696 family protein n=1 Tax=Achromobacter TaxID=222 RepID=UPI0006BF9DAE|nr:MULTISPECIES: hypothetical protein [Achromobacter]MCV6795788.1 hypothetical protein [Achromobacter ruhlandii]MCV6802233.1 hypothetical protein [Achromobacter ruhlandii]MCV6807760.1 hypothetical protein [Achromobacter ruhlandii]MCV6818101.1 hypothetical protein [Achromobacter ruhlandii]CUJ62198.1 Uncharacterised protein [Achromobacter xylosoxidans]
MSKPIDTSSEEWRRQCEARHVLSLPFDKRVPYLNFVGRKRGVQAQQYLETEVRRQHAKRRKAA